MGFFKNIFGTRDKPVKKDNHPAKCGSCGHHVFVRDGFDVLHEGKEMILKFMAECAKCGTKYFAHMHHTKTPAEADWKAAKPNE